MSGKCRHRLLHVAALFTLSLLFTSTCCAEHPLTFGVLAPLTGNFTVFGEANRCGVQGALKNTPARFNVVYGDTRGESATAVVEYKRLAAQHKEVFMFVQRSTSGMAVNSLSARDKLPLFGAVGHPAFTSSNPFAWQFWVSSDDEGGAIARAALKRDIKRIAVLTVDDEWTVTVSDGFRAAFTAGGGTLVMDESVLPTETDIKPLLMKVARRKADALFLNVGITQLGVGIKQARELGLTYPIYSTFWCATPDVLQTAGGAANGVTFVEMETNFPSFVRDVADCASNPPSAAVLSTYAATKFALQVLAAHPETRTMEQFATALGREREIKLPDISIPIQDRQIKFPVSVREIRNGRPEPAE